MKIEPSYIGASFDDSYTYAHLFKNADELIDEVTKKRYSDLIIIHERNAFSFIPEEVEAGFDAGTFKPGVWGLCFEDNDGLGHELVAILSPAVLLEKYEDLKTEMAELESLLNLA